ncbi:MAG: hypothetical protein EOM20_14380, partial [Spartobacteria bacterium]|nr:hypothetical protein [Spartobacteria bacterium]
VAIPEWTDMFRELKVSPKALRTHAKQYEGRYYALCPLFMDRDAARAYALQVNGDLAAITSAEQQAWVQKEFLFPGITAWLGGSDAHKEDDWQWLSGEKAGYSNWATGEPNNAGEKGEHALVMLSDGTWQDAIPDKPRPFLVEWKK